MNVVGRVHSFVFYLQQLLQINPKHIVARAEQTVEEEKRHGESCSKALCAQTSHLRVANTARRRQSGAAKRGQVIRKMLKRLARRSVGQTSGRRFFEDVSLSFSLDPERCGGCWVTEAFKIASV